jgi:hypothetical protein
VQQEEGIGDYCFVWSSVLPIHDAQCSITGYTAANDRILLIWHPALPGDLSLLTALCQRVRRQQLAERTWRPTAESRQTHCLRTRSTTWNPLSRLRACRNCREHQLPHSKASRRRNNHVPRLPGRYRSACGTRWSGLKGLPCYRPGFVEKKFREAVPRQKSSYNIRLFDGGLLWSRARCGPR